MPNDEHKNLQLVPEAVLKRKHDLDEMRAHRAAQAITNPRGNRNVFSDKSKAVKVRKPEKFLARARMRRHHEIRYKRVQKKGMQARASNKKVVKTKVVANDDADADQQEEITEVTYAANSVGAKVVFVVRIRDKVGMPRNVRKALSTLRLRHVNEGVLIRYNDSSRKMLHLVEPWVSYGVPSKAAITDLINRRGHGRVDGKRVPLSDNTIIENALGEETGIICVEDLVHELHSAGDNFGKASAFLWPFQLAAPRSKFQKEKLNFKDGGDYGDRGEEIDDLVRQML